MEHKKLIANYPKVVKQAVNLGELPYFEKIDVDKRRHISYHNNHYVNRFPRILSLERILDALEMNLFLEHRYKGVFKPPKRGVNKNSLGGVSLSTINSLANSLTIFLKWIEKNNVDWREVYAVSETDKAKYWLPVYRYRKYLIDLTIEGVIDRDTGNLYMNHVRQFYEWARKQRRIEKLPFTYKTKVIKKKRKDGELDLLFSNYAEEEKGIVVTTTDLIIPKKYRQKRDGDSELTPYDSSELKALYSTIELSKTGPRLRVDLACQCGLRADEITLFPGSCVINPDVSDQTVFSVEIVGKFGKQRTILVSKGLMTSLWHYKNTAEHQARLSKWQLLHGNCDEAPLFLNRSGEQLKAKSVANVISKARKELEKRGILLERTFHDLRSTFATNLAAFLLSKHLPIGFIQFKLMLLLGHSNFSTTQKYINFARSITFDKQMSTWVDKLFGEFVDPLKKDALLMTEKVGASDE